MFPSSGVPDVTVCNVTSSLVHVTVVHLEIAIASGAKYLPLLGAEEPGTMETVEPPVCDEVSITGGLESVDGTSNLAGVSGMIADVFDLFVIDGYGNTVCVHR